VETEHVTLRVPVALVRMAREALGRPDVSDSDLLRTGLAALAGVDVRDWTPRPGRPRLRSRT
jgi:hypothetical protein